MKISKKELQNALAIVKPGLASKDLMEQTTSFAFIDGNVVTYNDEISIQHPVPGLELEGAVLAENLYKFLGKINKDEIELEVGKNEIVLVSGRAKAGLTLQAEIKLPLDEELSQEGKWKPLPDNFLEAVSFAMTACSKDMSQPKLTCIHVNTEGIVEASDSYRVARYTLSEEMPVDSFLLPASSAIDMVRLSPTQIATGRGWMHFKTEEETIMSCRVVEESYVSVDQHLLVKGTKLQLPNATEEVLERAMVFAKRQHLLDENITITIGNKRLKMRAEAEGNTGWFEEEINMPYEGEKLSFMLVPHLLKDIISKTFACTLSTGKDKLKFEGEGWQYMTLLRKERS